MYKKPNLELEPKISKQRLMSKERLDVRGSTRLPFSKSMKACLMKSLRQ